MSSEQTDQVRRVADAFNRLDAEALVAECDPQVELETILGVLEGTVYRGHEGMRQWLRDTRETWREMRVAPEAVYDTGDRVVVILRLRADGIVTGASVDQRVVHVWERRDGKLLRGRSTSDVSGVLAELGLESLEPAPAGPGPRAIVRTGVAEDGPRVLALWRAAGLRPSATDDEDALATLRRQDPGALLVAEVDGELAGAIVAAWDGWRGSLYRLATHPAQRRRGVGAALVAAGERRLRDLGARRVSVLAVDVGSEAEPFWRAVGYLPDSGVRRFAKSLSTAAEST